MYVGEKECERQPLIKDCERERPVSEGERERNERGGVRGTTSEREHLHPCLALSHTSGYTLA